MRCKEKNTVNKIEENEPENLKNKLLTTDYAKVIKYKTKTVATTRKPFRHVNEQGYRFSIITRGISSHLRYLLEEKGVRLLSLSLLWSEDLYFKKHPCDGLIFSTSSKRNQKSGPN